MSISPTDTFPLVGLTIPHRTLIVVDFPAPFGPNKPKSSPRGTRRVRLSTATTSWYSFRRFSIIIASVNDIIPQLIVFQFLFRIYFFFPETTFMSCVDQCYALPQKKTIMLCEMKNYLNSVKSKSGQGESRSSISRRSFSFTRADSAKFFAAHASFWNRWWWLWNRWLEYSLACFV
ncbi:MAG: hypothetical protein RBG13Loki_3621 [Promethearchaeota archaeon CR_4]|nr:MAG: hypothetical protein RBG13Loki_3621 [Candidatus Lokiarchaeota archaeon CR_4]